MGLFPVFFFRKFECEVVVFNVHIKYQEGTPEHPHLISKYKHIKRFGVHGGGGGGSSSSSSVHGGGGGT